MTRRDALASAVLAGIVTAGTSTTALLNQVQSFDAINGPAWTVVVMGAVVTIAKDLQSRYSPQPRHPDERE